MLYAGALAAGVYAKDVILALIAQIGTGGGQGYVLEYRGSAIRALPMSGRGAPLRTATPMRTAASMRRMASGEVGM